MNKVVVIWGIIFAFANLSLASQEVICANDRVNFGSYVGTAVEVFSNGTVKIDVDGYTGYTFKDARELGRGVRCNYEGICQNDRVNFGSYVGTASEVFSNGIVKIDVDGYSGYTYKNAVEIGRGVSRLGPMRVNDRVVFSNYTGTAVELFDNGIVKIDVDGYSGYTYKSATELGYSVNCSYSKRRRVCRR